MSTHIYKQHNKTLLLYHLVCPIKYRTKAITKEVSESLRKICIGISERYEINFIEIGIDDDHVHFLVQSVPTLCVNKIVRSIKSITAKKIFQRLQILRKCYGVENFGQVAIMQTQLDNMGTNV